MDMLSNNVECPRCGKPGFLSLRWVRSSHYCLIEIPYNKPKLVKKEVINPVVRKGQPRTESVDRWLVTYGTYWHSYTGHYDAERYKKAMEKYKMGRLKSRPNGRRWCKVRYNRAKGEAQSDLEILRAKYRYTIRDIEDELMERRRKIRLQK